MHAAQLEKIGDPLKLVEIEMPSPGDGEVLIRNFVCGVCRTDLHIVDGELPAQKLPLIPGHQIVGEVVRTGEGVHSFVFGDRVGIPWLGWTCGNCRFCISDQENLCDSARFTGYHRNGGFAEYCVADARYCFSIPAGFTELQAAPLLCAGLIGYRAYRMTGNAESIGFYGFGSAAHLLLQVAQYEDRKIFAFTRPGDDRTQEFARKLGANWAGDSDTLAPDLLDAAIVFAPVGDLIPAALQAVRKGGTVVCAGIHMSDIPSFPYEYLWEERVIRSVANLTRKDGEDFLNLAAELPIRTQARPYPLERVNVALDDLRNGRFTGSAVIDLR